MIFESLFQHLTVGRVVVGGFVLILFFDLLSRLITNVKIRRIGLKAPSRGIPWPFGLDVAYHGIRSSRNNKVYEFFQEVMKKYANPNWPYTIEFRVGTRRTIMTSDDLNIKAILATQFNDYGKGENFNRDWFEFLGNSIFSTDGQLWHDSRQLIRPQFIKDRLSDIHIFEKHVGFLIPMLGGHGEVVDVLDLFFKFTLDASTDFLLGRSVDSLHHDETEFATAFNYVQHFQSLVARLNDLNWILPRSRFRKEIKIMNNFVEKYVNDALSLPPEELEKRTKSDEGYTFLHSIVQYTRDRNVLRDQLVAILLAGRDTTACTLSWLFYEISTRPHIVQRIRQEIMDYVGPTNQPTYDNLKAMKYLQYCLNETLRLYPIVPFNVREALQDTTLPRGGGSDGMQPVGVLKGTPVGYSTLAMQRRPDLYPSVSSGFPPIEDFVPERWYNWTPKSWTYIPFNAGPRICVGQQFALTEMAYTVTRILQRYDRIENRMKGPATFKADIVLQPADGVQLEFYKAQSEKI